MTSEEYNKAIVTISKDSLSKLPVADFKGKIIIVDDDLKFKKAIKDLRSSDIIGFDTETRPSFRKGQSYNVSLIQLSTPKKSYLIRTNIIGYPDELIQLLENPDQLKVGLSIHDDFHNLKKVIEVDPQGFIDLQNFVKGFKIADNSLSRLYGILFGERISKSQRLSNWEANELTESQQVYAALDSYACIRIYQHLKGGNFDPRNSKYLTLPPEQEELSKESEESNKVTEEA